MLSLREVATLTHGELVRAPSTVSSMAELEAIQVDAITTDSRDVPPGALFVALDGEFFDGHAFLDDVAARGARAVLVERGRHAATLPSVTVSDTRHALGDLAAGWRARFRMPLVVVTGSNGKTTTKEMIAAIMIAAFGEDGCCATRGNLNNDIGVPQTLLRLRTHHRAAVIEVGMNHPGETARLAQIARPDIALVVNAQREHQAFMQGVAAVADEHALAITALADDGIAVYPADDAYAAVWKHAAGARRIVDFVCVTARDAESSPAAVTGRAYLGTEEIVLHLHAAQGDVTARLSVAGLHNAHDATAAAAACIAAGIPLDAVGAGLESFRPMRGRSQRIVIDGNIVVIDDTYNANPDSMRAAIDLLASHPAPRLMVMGDMGEVGDEGPRFHAEIGRHARATGIETLYAFGTAGQASVDAFGSEGRHFETIESLIEAVESWVDARTDAGGAIAVKGSRFMRMERVVAALCGTAAGAH
ncbi:MAG: UDP-N-acetylmuramoyl-tripeptide--D-alanyl-D-alanine ligase [Burkholderiaceae bacterium]